jgi:hypothetical protein
MFSPLLESVLQEFDGYMAIYTSPILQQQFQPQDNWDQVLLVQLMYF